MKTPPCAARSTDDFYESICHNHRRCLWSAHSDACLACLRGRPAPGERPLVHSHHGRRRRAMSLGLAPAQALFALVMLKCPAPVIPVFAFRRILTLPPERRPPVRRHCPVLRRNCRVGDQLCSAWRLKRAMTIKPVSLFCGWKEGEAGCPILSGQRMAPRPIATQ